MENFMCLVHEMVQLSCGMEFLANALEQYLRRTMELTGAPSTTPSPLTSVSICCQALMQCTRGDSFVKNAYYLEADEESSDEEHDRRSPDTHQSGQQLASCLPSEGREPGFV